MDVNVAYGTPKEIMALRTSKKAVIRSTMDIINRTIFLSRQAAVMLLQGLLVVCAWWGCGKAMYSHNDGLIVWCFYPVSSSQLGPDNCTATVAINKPLSNTVTLYVSSGTACFECIINGVITTDATFLIGNSPVSEGSVVNGTLVVFDTESVFSTSTNVRCHSGGEITRAAIVEHTSMLTY